MEEINPALESDAFVVKESQRINIFFGASMLLIVAIAAGSGYGLTGTPILFIVLLIGAGILFIAKGIFNREILRIDCNGIYHHNAMLTNWNNFLQADIQQANNNRSISNDFQLVLQYRKDNIEGYFSCTIPLTNTQDQPEEAVLEAIRKHYELSQGNIIPLKDTLQIDNTNT